MSEKRGDAGASGVRESRRRFFQLLAGSPLLAAAYPALPPAWQEAVAREAQRGATTGPRPTGVPCPDCGQEMVFPTSVATRSLRSRADQRRPTGSQPVLGGAACGSSRLVTGRSD